jgi:hypothetical protein
MIFCCSREEHGGPFCFSVSRVVGRQKGFSFPARNSSAEWLYLLEHAARLFAQEIDFRSLLVIPLRNGSTCSSTRHGYSPLEWIFISRGQGFMLAA